MNRFSMTTEVKINLFLLTLVHCLFFRFTTPSPTIQPLLHAVFGIGILTYCVSADWATRLFATHTLAWVFSLLPMLLFSIVWTSGIVAVTRLLSWLMSIQNGTEASLFYGTSGTQFFHYSDTQWCWVLLLPIAILTILIHLILRRSQ